jgi:hypothetical protein
MMPSLSCYDATGPMRTTVTLDDDLVRELKRLAQEREEPFKRVLNEAIRAGLSETGRAAEPFQTSPSPLRLRRDIDFAKALRLAADLEDEALARKREQGR